MFILSGMIPKVQYASNFPYSFVENFLQNEQKIVNLKRVVKNKKIKCYDGKFMFTSLFFQISASDVCGCPLVTNVFEETGDFCRASKRRCLKHYSWEKLRRAEIDLQRIQQVEMCSRCGGGLIVSALRIEQSWFEPWPGPLCYVLGWYRLLSQCLSPSRCMNGCQRIIGTTWQTCADGLALHPGE